MIVSNISLAYFFLGTGIITAIFFVYFKVLVVKSSPNNEHRDEIIGEMKDPDHWRERNNKMAYLSLFWAVLSTAIFIYLMYFFGDGALSVVYPFIYVGLIGISASYLTSRHKEVIH